MKLLEAVVFSVPPPRNPLWLLPLFHLASVRRVPEKGGHGWVAGICQPWERILGAG